MDKPTDAKPQLGQPVASVPNVDDALAGYQEFLKQEEPPTRLPIGSTIGGVAGSLAALRLGLGAGPSMRFGAAGSAVGEVAQQAVETFLELDTAPKTAKEALTNIAQETALGTAGDVAGRLIVGGVAKLAAPFRSALNPEGVKAAETIEASSSLRPGLTPAEQTNSHVLDTAQQITEGSIMGGGFLKIFKENQAKALESMADQVIDQFGKRSSPEDLGDYFIAVVEGKLNLGRAPARIIYNTIDERVAQKTVEVPVVDFIPTGLFDEAGNQVNRQVTRTVQQEVGGAKVNMKPLRALVGKEGKNLDILKGFQAESSGKTVKDFIEGLSGEITYGEARAVSTGLREFQERLLKSPETKNAKAIRFAGKVMKQLDKQLEQSLREFDPELVDMAKAADKIWRDTSLTYNNRTIRRLANLGRMEHGDAPERIAKRIFAPGNVTAIKRVKAAVTPKAWMRLQSFAVRQMMKTATDTDGVMKGKSFLAELTSKRGMGEEMFEEVFDKTQRQALEDFGQAAKVAQAKQVGAGRIMSLAQGGAILQIMSEGPELFPGQPEMVILGPAAVAFMLTNPRSARWLTQGFDIPANSAQGAALAGRILQALNPRQVDEAAPTAPQLGEPSPERLPAAKF